ncbi:MAG: nucleotidyltransferase domain-containing protein [Bacteroidota bacterium]|nr:nucleotidyltransferase domain-containing protein [Bacteroidota bacterium]
MHTNISNKIPLLINICKQYKVTKLYLFGSVLTEKFNNKSDIDLLVEFDKKLSPLERGELFWQLNDMLPSIFYRKVDLITTDSLRNKYFIENINKTKMVIYE